MHGERTEHGDGSDDDRQSWPSATETPLSDLHNLPNIIASFEKGGRQISVGDCALFQAGKTLPFVGIIRKVSIDEEGSIQLSVNWLYRPADVKLAKEVPFDTAPNEIFYSFHQDSISAISLLHPCKVYFLRKGAELPLGISSFVCRRVYDVANKCLWWLTDRDYSDVHQEEVDQLLDRNKLEMQAAVQSGAPSPRGLASNSCGQQPKASSDHVPNSAPSTAKNKKRERTDQISEPIKRERSSKVEDSEMLVKRDSSMKADDIWAIVDTDGGLFNLAGVDKLVALMQQERNDALRKVVDVASRRSMLTGVIAATEKEDCLNRFVQLGGLPLLDDWLQEAHKGKFGDGESLKEGERVCEDLLLTLLRALDKLPVDLDALKTCIVGKSVNNLRSHKNVEVQKKARKLVDIWKKRVDAEMKHSGDAKPGPMQGVAWSPRQPQGDPLASHLVRNGGPPDVSLKNSGLSSIKEEKSSSSPSQNFGPSWPNAPLKGTMNICWKEDARNSSVASPKLSGSVFRSNGKGLIGGSNGLGQKEISGGKAFGWSRNAIYEKPSNPSMVPEKGVVVTSPSEVPSNQRLIVRLPNPGRSPARSVSAGSMVDSPAQSRGSSPTVHERHVTSIPAETTDCKSRLPYNVQAEASSEAVSEIRSSCGKLKTMDGDSLKECDVLMEKETDMNTAENSVPTAGNCSSGDENFPRNGKHVGGGNSCISSVSAQKTSTEGSTEVDCRQKAEDSTIAAHEFVENVSPVVDAATMREHNGAISILATAAASQDISHAGSDSGPTTASWGVVPEKKASLPSIVSSSPPGDAFDKNSLCRSKDSKVTGDEDNRKELHSSDPHLASSAPVQSCERPRSGVKTQGKDIESSPYKLPSGTSNGDGTNDSKKDKDMTHDVSSLEGESKLNTAKQHGLLDSPAGACVDTIGKVLHHNEFMSDPMNEKIEISVEAARAGQGANNETVAAEFRDGSSIHEESNSNDGRISVALDISLDRSFRSGEIPVPVLDELSGRVSEELAREEKETTSGSVEDALDVARQVVKEVEQKIQNHSMPVSGSSSDLEIRDAILISGQESIDKTRCVFKSTRSSSCNESREKMKHKKNSSQMPGKADTDSTDNERKLEEVSSVKSLNIVLADEVSVSYGDDAGRNLQVDAKASEASLACLTKYVVGSTGQSIVKSLQMASQTVGSSAQVVPSSSASSHDILKSSANSHAEELVSPDHVMQKALRTGDISGRPAFDLNEGLEDIQEDLAPVVPSSFSTVFAPSVSCLTSNSLTAPIAVMASTNGTFIPPASPLRFNKEFGWKGSAATSAFRPAEPRRTPERQQTLAESSAADSHSGSIGKQVRPFDIDLNVMDNRSMEDMGLTTLGTQPFFMELGGHVITPNDAVVSSVRLASDGPSSSQQLNPGYVGARPDLDLNRAEDCVDGVLDHKGNCTSPAIRNVVRDFDLNDGPVPSFEETGHDEFVLRHVPARSTGAHMISAVSGLRMNGEMADVTPWWPHGNSFSAVAIPAYPGSRGDPAYTVTAAPQPFLNAGMCVTPFNNELYRAGAALSSSPAVAFPTAPPGGYPYSAFQFGASFPSSSFTSSSAPFVDAASVSSFPSITSQMVTHGAVAPAYVRPPFLMSVPEGTSADSSGLWGRLNLDLNAGPEAVDTDAGNARHSFILSSQPSIEDQLRAFRQVGASGAALKRKEPEGGLEFYRSGSKHSWR